MADICFQIKYWWLLESRNAAARKWLSRMYCLALLIVVDSRSRVRSFRGDRNKENGDPPFDTTPTILTLKASPVVNLATPIDL